jgi:hypothetical protein
MPAPKENQPNSWVSFEVNAGTKTLAASAGAATRARGASRARIRVLACAGEYGALDPYDLITMQPTTNVGAGVQCRSM